MNYSIAVLLMSLMVMEDGAYGVSIFTAETEMKTVCKEESCFTCLANTCTRFCTGTGCPECLQGLETCCQSMTGASCLLCYGATCCGDVTCNHCVGTCAALCIQEVSCYADCFYTCTNSSSSASSPSSPPPHKVNGTKWSTSGNQSHSPRFNVTTVIRITNYINNTQHIDTPVYANHTNNQTINVREAIAGARNTSQWMQATITGSSRIRCCNVSHPRVCYPTTKGRLCQFKRHVECSSICRSKHVLIGPGNGTTRAIPVAVSPYIYYGNYDIIDCLKCYSCDGSAGVKMCSKQATCPKECRENIEAENESLNGAPRRHRKHQIVNVPQPQPQPQAEYGSYLQSFRHPYQPWSPYNGPVIMYPNPMHHSGLYGYHQPSMYIPYPQPH